VFPGLTVTSLIPGETIKMVIHTPHNLGHLMNRIGAYSRHLTTVHRLTIISIHQGYVETNISRISVPTNAITTLPTKTPVSPTRIIPSTTSTQTSSSVPAGAIAGGVVGGIVALGAIFALLWYVVRAQSRSQNTEPTIDQHYQGAGSPYNHPISTEKTDHEQRVASPGFEEPTTYLGDPENPPSANLGVEGRY
jgi:hypothetical protein